ncbi:MAG: recombinase family protein [Sphaerochaetaceae bacterium]
MKIIKRIANLDMPIPRRKRVAAYCRVSIDEELNMHSLSTQVDYYSKLIKGTPGWEYVGVYADGGFTGTRSNRPGFQRLLDDCESGKVDMILTKSISRFARNTVLLISTVRHLKEKGIQVRFEREGINTISEDGELMLSLLAAFAQEESRSISENVTWAIRKKFKEGRINQYQPLFGYRWNGKEFAVIPEEAEAVRFVFQSYLDGRSPDQIALMLNKNGVKPIKGGPFRYQSVWAMLRQEKYTGNAILQKTFKRDHLSHKSVKNHGELDRYIAEGSHPVIISQETFDAVQKEIGRRQAIGFMANQGISFSYFTSLVKCPLCGKSYRRRTHKHSVSGTSYYSWICSTKLDKSAHVCPACNLPEKVLLELTAEVLGLEDGIDGNLVKERIKEIQVFEHELLFLLSDGNKERRTWKDASRNVVYERRRIHG